MCSVPQYAYLPGRGTDDALIRVFRHCDAVRTTCQSHRFPLQQMALGLKPGPLEGGLLVTLDLSKAFDMVPRGRLFRCLSNFGVPSQLIDFLNVVYFDTSFSFQHRGQTRHLGTSRGIRQGCKAAPTLWAAYITEILLDCGHNIDEKWLYDCLTMYADDGCMHEVVTSPEQFVQTVHKVGITLDLLEAAKLTINLEKTYAMLRLVGTAVAKTQKQYIMKTSKGAFSKIPRSGQITYIRLVKHFQYLGATVCYYNFERATTLARIKASEKTGQQLHRWLHTTRGFQGHQKYKLWKQCVFTTLRYSLMAVGYTPQTVTLIDIACFKQLRRIFRAPTHLTLQTHQEFLETFHLTDPLLQLVAFCQDAQVRELHRRNMLSSTDILLRDTIVDYDQQMQVLTNTWYHLRHRHLRQSTALPDSQMICPECFIPFASMAQLRKHQNETHGDRSGAIRPFALTDRAGGVPTCSRCQMQFTTHHSLTYHVQFVCMAPAQDIEEVEHRVRVQEMLQYARGQQLQALANDQAILAYFKYRCALCSFFSITVKGLHMHWQRDHSAEYQRHEAVNELLLPHFEHDSPCRLCGTSFKQYHKCHIVRQMALLLTKDGHEAARTKSSLVCKHCGKAYTTRHGLLQHERRYHRAEEAVEDVPATDIDLQCLIHQAVLANKCEDLLLQEDIQHFLSTRCIKCQKQYVGKRELHRHFKQNHSTTWHACEQQALELDRQWKPQHGCVCVPPSYTKHICLVYFQFALLRLDQECQLMPQLLAEPPDVILSVVEQIEPLLWLGLAHNLYRRSALKMNLTMHCQVCGYSGANAEDLRLHLHAAHPVHLQESLYLKEMFQWSMFMEMGCFCNPSPGWGTQHHECVGLTQLAIIAASFNWQVVLPWPFSSHDLMVLLADMLPCADLQKISMALITRNFHLLWEDSTLLGMLATRCLICQEQVDLHHIQAHLVVRHQITADKLKYITHQLSAVFATLSLAEERCDWCHDLLPSYLDSEDEMCVDPHAHLQKCPMISQMALLLMHPKWSSPALQPLTWASQEKIAETRQQHALKMWQFNVSTSETFGTSLELTAQCGLQLLEDELIADCLTSKCLLCSKVFFIHHHMIQHLHSEHNFLQFQTYMCYKRLLLRCADPCQFCGLKKHATQCPALLNLAVFLLNGFGIRGLGRHRCGYQDLGQSFDGRSDGRFGHCSPGQQRFKAPKDRSERSLQFCFNHSANGSLGHSVSPGHEARGHHQQPPPGEPVFAPFGPRPREHPSLDAGHQQNMAPADGEICPAATPVGSDHDPGDGQETTEIDGGNAHRGIVQRLQVLQFGEGRRQQDNAVATLEPSAQMPGAHRATRLTHPGSPSQSTKHTEADDRGSSSDAPIPQPEEASGGERTTPGASMDLDSGAPQLSGAVARSGPPGLSQFLAASASAPTTSGIGAHTTGQATTETHVTCIPIFMNSTGTACFANVVMISLAWLTLLANGNDPSQWVHGFELLRNIFLANHMPMDLPKFGPFVWLLLGDWSVESFRNQHDVCEFATYLLHVMQPQFLHCSWATKPGRLAIGEDLLPSEKGTRFAPIKLDYADHTADSSSLQSLVDMWHVMQGFCRAAEEVGFQLILQIDRFNPETRAKCQQLIDIADNSIRFPFFSNWEGDVIFDSFEICAIIYHLGTSPLAGHYRVALRYQKQWMIYEDGRPPDQTKTLPDTVLRNSVMYWLVRPSAITARTMESEDPRLFRSFRTIARDVEDDMEDGDGTS